MHTETIAYYDRCSGVLSAQYARADMSWLCQKIECLIPPGACILEVGCGNGRDARKLASKGFSVTACDASPGMLAHARVDGKHGNLKFLCRAFPLQEDDDLLSSRFDLVLSIAMIMHLPQDQLALFVKQVSSMLNVNGKVFLSWCNRKSEDGRLYENIEVEYLIALLRSNSVDVLECAVTNDSLGRPVTWNSIVARKLSVVQCGGQDPMSLLAKNDDLVNHRVER